jgi:hypothetical protein
MQLNTTTALATALISAVIGFGLAFYIERKLSGGLQNKSQKILTSIAMISFGYGLMATLNEVIGFPLQGLQIRYDKLVGYVIFNILLIPIIFLVMAKLMGLKVKAGEPTIYNYEQQTKTRASAVERKVNENFSENSTNPNFQNFKNNIKSDDSLWEEALEEFESRHRIKGLYAKLYTQHDGNEQRIKSQYIKERFEQLKKQQKETQVEEDKSKIQLAQQERKLALENKYKNKKIKSIKLIGDTEFYTFEDGSVAFKVNENQYGLYTNLESAQNALNYSNLYGSVGFIDLITINTDKVIIPCPKCKINVRVPANKELEIKCPSCKFEWQAKT